MLLSLRIEFSTDFENLLSVWGMNLVSQQNEHPQCCWHLKHGIYSINQMAKESKLGMLTHEKVQKTITKKQTF